MSAPIVSLAISSNCSSTYWLYSTGHVDLETVDPSTRIFRVQDSTEVVRETLRILLVEDFDFICIHNGFNYDCPVMAFHSPPEMERYFDVVSLGVHNNGVDLRIPGTTMVDTCFYLSKVHRSDYQGMSLSALALHYGLPEKMNAPSMFLDVTDDNDMTKMAEYNIHDAQLHWMLAVESQCIEEIVSLSTTGRSPSMDVTTYITGTMVVSYVASYN